MKVLSWALRMSYTWMSFRTVVVLSEYRTLKKLLITTIYVNLKLCPKQRGAQEKKENKDLIINTHG